MMKKIEIKNIQSHKKSELELCDGINAIVGSSNNGKSAILRALNWAIKNRPLGTDILLSHWAINEKGNQNDEMYVKVTDDVGNILSRRRTKDENQYIINGKELNVVKTDVPEEVERFFRLSDTNIQCQQDSPFLLSLSSGEVARYFNRTVKLDMIDKILAEAESRTRRIRSEKEILENDIKTLEERLNNFSWTEGIDILISKYKRVQEKNSQLSAICDSIRDEIDELKKQKILPVDYEKKLIEEIEKTTLCKNDNLEELDFLSDSILRMKESKVYYFGNHEQIISDIEKAESEFSENKKSSYFLFNDLSKIRDSKTYDFTSQKKLIDELGDLVKGSRLKYDSINLQEDVEEIINCNKDIQDCNTERDELWQEMPDICPVCGKPLDIDKKC